MKTVDELIRIADLAKLSMDGEDLDALMGDMEKYIAIADIVRDADLTGHDCELERELAPLREDTVIPSYPVDELMKNAADSRDGHYVADTGGRRGK